MKPDLTMFSDASVFPALEKSGWGFWIKGDERDSMHAGGPLQTYSGSTCVAELEAIANGIHCASVAGYFLESDFHLMIQSDSVEALGCLLHQRPATRISEHEDSAKISRRKKALCKRRATAVKQIFQLLDSNSLTPVLRHVRGHKAGGGRNFVNRLCDRLAKDGARAA